MTVSIVFDQSFGDMNQITHTHTQKKKYILLIMENQVSAKALIQLNEVQWSK